MKELSKIGAKDAWQTKRNLELDLGTHTKTTLVEELMQSEQHFLFQSIVLTVIS